jgi:hypothetical protein
MEAITVSAITPRRKVLFVGFFVCALALIAASQRVLAQPQTLGAIVGKIMVARGGYDALRQLRTIVIEYDIKDMKNPSERYSAIVRARRDGWNRTELFRDGQPFFSGGVDGEGEWEAPAGLPPRTVTDPKEAASARHNIDLMFGLTSASRRGMKLSLEPRQKVREIRYHVIRQRFDNGFERFLFVNPRTWLIDFDRSAEALRPESPDEDKTEEIYSDYRTIDGLVWPFRDDVVSMVTGNVELSAVVTKITYNVELGDGLLTRSQ